MTNTENQDICECGHKENTHVTGKTQSWIMPKSAGCIVSEKINGKYVLCSCKKFKPQTQSQDNRYTEAIANPDTQTPSDDDKKQKILFARGIADEGDIDMAITLTREAEQKKHKQTIQRILDRIETAQEDYANLDWISKEQAEKIIKQETEEN